MRFYSEQTHHYKDSTHNASGYNEIGDFLSAIGYL